MLTAGLMTVLDVGMNFLIRVLLLRNMRNKKFGYMELVYDGDV